MTIWPYSNCYGNGVETITSIPSPAWKPPLDGQRSNYLSNLHTQQTDDGTRIIKQTNNSASINRIDGGWQPSLHVNTEETEESKSASAWSVISNHSAPSTLVAGSNDARKPDAMASCRLFGFDLKSPSVATLRSVDVPNDNGEINILSTLSSADSEQKSSVSKEFRDVKQDQLQLPTKEVQSRQSNSSRSRTKVHERRYYTGS